MDDNLMKQSNIHIKKTVVENLAGVRRNAAPARLIECEKCFMEGRIDSWYEYIPDSYDNSRDVPLVIQVHGGNWDGYRDAQAPSWRVLAEQKNFIVVYPNSYYYGHWECDDADVAFLHNLILEICRKYRIDRTRIYMQGMSNGDKMASTFIMKYPKLIAAAGLISGPWDPDALTCFPKGNVPCIQLRGEKDISRGPGLEPWKEDHLEKRGRINDFNRELWMKINQTDQVPAVHIAGKDNFLRYPGEKGDVIYWEIKDMGHVEPNYLAWRFWNYLYSGWRRVDGEAVREEAEITLEGDEDVLAFAVGANQFFQKNQVKAIGGKGRVIRIETPKDQLNEVALELQENSCKSCIYVPLEIIAAAGWGDCRLDIEENIADISFTDGGQLRVYGESCNAIYNNSYHTLKKPCIYRSGVFYLPILEIAGELLQLFAAQTDDTVILSHRYCELTKGAARILKKLVEISSVSYR